MVTMKNNYKIDGDTLIVYNRKDNKEMLFDAEDFDLLYGHTWCIDGKGYVRTTINFKGVLVHRYVTNCSDKLQIDHINGNKQDNRKINLRKATAQTNHHNRTQARGYDWIPKLNKWRARIGLNNKLINLGHYDTEAEARQAYLNAKKKYHPSAPHHLFT